MLLVLAVILTRRTKKVEYMDVDISGMLQMAWMLGDPHLADVDTPELDKLRPAGMYTVEPSDMLLRRSKNSSVPQNKEGRDSAEYLVTTSYEYEPFTEFKKL